MLRVLVILPNTGDAEKRASGVGVAMDDEFPRPLLGRNERLHERRRMLAIERFDELDRWRPEVKVLKVDPHAGGHSRQGSTNQRELRQEPNIDAEITLPQHDPAAPPVDLLMIA